MTDLNRAIELVTALLTGLKDDSLDVNSVVNMTTEITEAFIEAKTTRVPASKLGLNDIRCGSVLLEGDYPDSIIADGMFSEYYAGFDYVDRSAVTKVGRYTIYSGDDSRVEEALSYYVDQN